MKTLLLALCVATIQGVKLESEFGPSMLNSEAKAEWWVSRMPSLIPQSAPSTPPPPPAQIGWPADTSGANITQ